MNLNAGGLANLVIGRDDEVTTLATYIQMSQHTVVTAPRRYGKTTLVNKVLNDLKDEYLIVKVDFFEASSLDELCNNYINAIYKSIGIVDFIHSIKESVFSLLERVSLQYEKDGIKLGYEIIKENDINIKLQKTFEFAQKFAHLFGKKMIVFFDEFGDSSKFGDEFLKKLRSYMQRHKNIIYIFAGSQTSIINNIFLNQDSAFFNFASLMNIGFLDDVQTETFLNSLKIGDKTLSPEVIGVLIKKTKLHPFYLIKTIGEVYILSLINKSKITVDLVYQAIGKILKDNNAYFEYLWNHINNKKYKGSILKSCCRKTDLKIDISSSYKSQLIRELINEAIINNKQDMVDPFFCLWLNKDKYE